MAVTEKDKLVNKLLSVHPTSDNYGIKADKFTIAIHNVSMSRLPGLKLWKSHPLFETLEEAKESVDFLSEFNPERNYCVVARAMKPLYEPRKEKEEEEKRKEQRKYSDAASALYDIIREGKDCTPMGWSYEKRYVNARINGETVRLQVQEIP